MRAVGEDRRGSPCNSTCRGRLVQQQPVPQAVRYAPSALPALPLQVNILRELKHPFIVRYYDRIIDKATTKLYIVMEYCEGGDLGAIIKKCKKDG